MLRGQKESILYLPVWLLKVIMILSFCYPFVNVLICIYNLVVRKLCLKSNQQYFCSYAGAIFADACLKGLNGVPDIVECSFVQSSITELPFFASKVNYSFMLYCYYAFLGFVHSFDVSWDETLFVNADFQQYISLFINFSSG